MQRRDYFASIAGLVIASLGVGGCQAVIGDPVTTPSPEDAGVSAEDGGGADASVASAALVSYPTECEPASSATPGRSPLRRLTVAQYDNTVRDLLGDTSAPAQRLVDGERGATSADERLVTTLLAEQYQAAAEDVASRLDLASLTGCDSIERACARAFIAPFLDRAFRRPVDAATIAAYEDLFDQVEAELGSSDAVISVVEAVLQAPSFLYLVETSTADGPVRPLDGHEMAVRLSYFLWSTMPDETLRTAAEAGELANAAGVERHARRMIADQRAEGMLQRFFARYLELEALEGVQKDPSVFPDFTPVIATLMHRETEHFIRAVLVDGDGSWRTLMTAPFTYVNRELATFYGLEPPTGDGFQRVPIDGDFYSGVLTHGALMASRARPYETSPIHRGMFVRGTLLCGIVPDVPEGLEVTPPDPDPNLTTRARLSEHRANPVCGSCHRQIDPLGFAFEHFDGAGRFRADEGGLVLDTTGDIVDVIGGDRTFDGVPDLAGQIVDSEQGPACFSAHWLRYGAGRALDEVDGCTIQTLTRTFVGANYDVRELIVALTMTDAFRYRSEEIR